MQGLNRNLRYKPSSDLVLQLYILTLSYKRGIFLSCRDELPWLGSGDGPLRVWSSFAIPLISMFSYIDCTVRSPKFIELKISQVICVVGYITTPSYNRTPCSTWKCEGMWMKMVCGWKWDGMWMKMGCGWKWDGMWMKIGCGWKWDADENGMWMKVGWDVDENGMGCGWKWDGMWMVNWFGFLFLYLEISPIKCSMFQMFYVSNV